MNGKNLKYMKLVLYILCFSSLVLPMNFDAYTNKWIFGINYIINLFSGVDKEGIYWFLYYLILYILPVGAQIVFWSFSKRGITSDIFDVVASTGMATFMFCFYISLKHSPIGIMLVMILQIAIMIISCIRLISRFFSQEYFDEMFDETRKKKFK